MKETISLNKLLTNFNSVHKIVLVRNECKLRNFLFLADNRTKRRRILNVRNQDFTVFAERRGENNRIRISPQLTLATFQYLSTSKWLLLKLLNNH